MSGYMSWRNSLDLKKFCKEIKERTCLWNADDNSYGDRLMKDLAWNEIAAICISDWAELTYLEKRQNVDALQKKWKTMRDYYVREKKKRNGDIPKQQNKSYFCMMTFLDDQKQFKNLQYVADQSEGGDGNAKLFGSNRGTRTPKLPNVQESLLKRFQEQGMDESNKSLISMLLTEITQLMQRQNSEFRNELLNKIIAFNTSKNEIKSTPETSENMTSSQDVSKNSYISVVPITNLSDPNLNRNSSPSASSEGREYIKTENTTPEHIEPYDYLDLEINCKQENEAESDDDADEDNSENDSVNRKELRKHKSNEIILSGKKRKISRSETVCFNCKQAEDEFDTYGRHVSNQLRKLKLPSAVQLQSDIQNLITEARLKDS